MKIKIGKNLDNQSDNPWQQVETEMRIAQQARDAGSEGKARVCTRRAVGQALHIYGINENNSLSAIQAFIEVNEIPDEIRELSKSLLEKVNENYQLRPGVDLLGNAEKIIAFIRTSKDLSPDNHQEK